MSNIAKGTGVLYTTGIPNTIPNINFDAEFALDVTNGFNYAWNRTTNVWDNVGQGIEILSTSGEPPHEPSGFEPRFALNTDRELYYFTKPRTGTGFWSKLIATPFKTILISLSQTGTSNPVGTVLYDEIANDFNYTTTRTSTGTYKITNSTNSPFTGQVIVNCNQIVSNGTAYFVKAHRTSDSEITILSYNTSGALVDLETNLPLLVEIRVYNV